MHRKLPSTPIEALEISAGLRFTMNMVCKAADLFGFWNRPFKGAATSFEEMTLLDKFYWVYKCTNPITQVERGENTAGLFSADGGVIGLPPDFEKRNSLTLGAAGDLFRVSGIEDARDVVFENIADLLFDQDISYANFESPVTGQELKEEVVSDKESPIECCSRDHFDVLKGHAGKHFTVLHTANNHIFDMGTEGLETTIKALSDAGILDVGINVTPDDFGRGTILTREGFKIGFASATFSLNGRDLPAGEEWRINVARMLSKFADAELDLLKRQIDDCRAQGCDFIIASLHGGHEFEFFPRRRQVETARTLVEWGADAVIAHHPHVVQPVEYYRTRRDPDRIAVIAYSLGSLLWSFSAPHLALSAILNLTLTKGRFQDRDVTYIENARVTPVFRSAVGKDGDLLPTIEKLADHLDGRSDRHDADYIGQIKRYADLIFGSAA